MAKPAQLRRSEDHSIWLKHITDEIGDTLKLLEETNSEQDVVLRLDGLEGTWTRFKALPNGTKSTGFRCKDSNAREIWNKIPVNAMVSVELIRRIEEVAGARPPAANASRRKCDDPVSILVPLQHKVCGEVLGIGIDCAWWGGSKKSRDSRAESVAFSLRSNGQWQNLEIDTADLNPSFNPNADEYSANADADAGILFQKIQAVLENFKNADSVVVAIDVPILAAERGLPSPKKANAKGERGGVYRQCDEAWMRARANAPSGWTGVNVLPGAPIVPRCRELLLKLRSIGFEVFGLCDTSHKHQIIECFPNEIVWSIGAAGLNPELRPDSLQQYKRLGKKTLPLEAALFHATWKGTLQKAMKLAGCDDALQARWASSFKAWLEASTCFDQSSGIGFTGKAFDDAVESVLSLTSAVAFADGKAHIHTGMDPKDGHIIGPGQ